MRLRDPPTMCTPLCGKLWIARPRIEESFVARQIPFLKPLKGLGQNVPVVIALPSSSIRITASVGDPKAAVFALAPACV